MVNGFKSARRRGGGGGLDEVGLNYYAMLSSLLGLNGERSCSIRPLVLYRRVCDETASGREVIRQKRFLCNKKITNT